MNFDRCITVDWSASNRPKLGQDSIWICDLRRDTPPVTSNPTTRLRAEYQLRTMLLEAVSRRERVLIGFDFPYGYPQGFAAALGLAGPQWSAIWGHLVAAMRDDITTNENNRFEVAAAINARLPHAAFWGCPPARLCASLSSRRDKVAYKPLGLDEWREVERLLRSLHQQPQSVWKLLGAGSVGSQALTGIPVVSRLRDDPTLAAISKVWPFEVSVPDLPEGRAAIVHAEIWPSMVAIQPMPGQVKDEAQVIHIARQFLVWDQIGRLPELFAAPRPGASEEGWILGIP